MAARQHECYERGRVIEGWKTVERAAGGGGDGGGGGSIAREAKKSTGVSGKRLRLYG